MKAPQKKPIKIVLSRSLCMQICGSGTSKGGGIRDQQEVKVETKSSSG